MSVISTRQRVKDYLFYGVQLLFFAASLRVFLQTPDLQNFAAVGVFGLLVVFLSSFEAPRFQVRLTAVLVFVTIAVAFLWATTP